MSHCNFIRLLSLQSAKMIKQSQDSEAHRQTVEFPRWGSVHSMLYSFMYTKDEVTGKWRRLHNEKLHDLY